MTKLFPLLVLAIAFGACRPKPIDINVDPAPSKLVVFSHAVPNNVMIISLTKSFSLLENISEDQYDEMLVSGATVQVNVDGQNYDFYELSPGFYASFTSLISNAKSFKLSVNHQGETVSATTSTAAPVSFFNFQPSVDKTPTDTTVRIQMSFQDIPNEANFYMINVYKKNADSTSFDGVNYFENGNNALAETILISDLEFNGNYDENIKFDNLYHEDSIAVTLSNISEQYYNYLVLRNESGSVFTQLNLEPLNYPTNVENGYGFFNAHIPDVKFDDLGQY